MNTKLIVWYGEKPVGVIWKDTANIMGFRYEKSWQADGFPISLQLPLSQNEYEPQEGKAHRFFANLLPEAHAREYIVRALKISNTDFELLKAIGGECAGAFSILPETLAPQHKAEYHVLSDSDLRTMLLRKGALVSFGSDEMRPRLSLAGAHDKCPVLVKNEQFAIPLGTSPSTHIIKFEVGNYRNIPVFECFMLALARSVGLSVPQAKLCHLEKDYFLLVKRYDRVIDNNQVKRLHQEDFCQGLGIGHDRKYQQDGGPSFLDCYQLLQSVSSDVLENTQSLLKWQIFNVLAGNSDGHAKNLSIIYHNKQIALAPFYDLVCTRAIDGIDTRLAMSVGGEFDPDKLSLSHWDRMAEECGIAKNFLRKMLGDMAQELLDKVTILEKEFNLQALQRIRIVVRKQCKKMLLDLGKVGG